MNYFSHYFVDHIQHAYAYNTGLLLPDVTRGWIKTFREPIYQGSVQKEFYEGCLAHYRADKNFHASVFFNQILRTANDLISGSPFSAQLNRKWFLAHIMAELMIDRILVKKYPDKLDGFYESLDLVDEKELSAFLSCYGMHDQDKFFELFNHFRKMRYIYYYADNNKFVYSLNRIMLRAGTQGISEADQQILKETCLSLEQAISVNEETLAQQLINSTKDDKAA